MLATDSIPVSWQPIPIKFTNGLIVGYTLRFWLISIGKEKTNKQEVKVIHLSSLTQFIELNNLEMFAKYGIEVSGYTKKGDGPAAFTTAGKKLIRNQSVSNTQLLV